MFCFDFCIKFRILFGAKQKRYQFELQMKRLNLTFILSFVFLFFLLPNQRMTKTACSHRKTSEDREKWEIFDTIRQMESLGQIVITEE